MNSDGSNIENLTLNFNDDEGGVWSPSGLQIAFQSGRLQNGNELWVKGISEHNDEILAEDVLFFSYAWQPCPLDDR